MKLRKQFNLNQLIVFSHTLERYNQKEMELIIIVNVKLKD